MKVNANPFDELLEKSDQRVNQHSFNMRTRQRFRSFNNGDQFLIDPNQTKTSHSSMCLPRMSVSNDLGSEVCKCKTKDGISLKMKKLKISSFNIGQSKDIEQLCDIIFDKVETSTSQHSQIPTAETDRVHTRKDCFGKAIIKKGKDHKICFADTLNIKDHPLVQTKKDVSFSRITRKMNTLYDSETIKNEWSCIIS